MDKSRLIDPTQKIGLTAMSSGIREIVVGMPFIISNKLTIKYSSVCVIVTFIIHITFYLMFKNLPNEAPFKHMAGVHF